LKHILNVNNYKHGGGADLWCFVPDKFNVVILRKPEDYAEKLITKSYTHVISCF